MAIHPQDLDYEKLREAMVREQLVEREIVNFRVLEAMRRVPRHEFVPPELQHMAYQDGALPIGHNQTISQPYVVALMLQLMQLAGHETVLEIGTGSGYQTALLAELSATVFSVELNATLAEEAGQRLAKMGYHNLEIYVGDGSQGLADMGPYDAIVVSAAVPAIPSSLSMQLRNNGRMVLPVGNRRRQNLQLAWRDFDQWHVDNVLPVRFVPLVGRYGFREG
ncbi:MAG: protein-L-isoaspartate(D-aspartate) O-methyltransferase [Anaerolineae bacterium]|nr:protein-L-isoaspartate(D-aspartate) O-methyltransferase [Anaerolineae bacterium]